LPYHRLGYELGAEDESLIGPFHTFFCNNSRHADHYACPK
jgi:hypothetical protein